MHKGKWKIVRKLSRKISTVWVVTRTKNRKTQRGYFKILDKKSKKYAGPLLANELISYRLARALNLKAAKIKLAKIERRRGVVSIVRPARRHYTWAELSKKLNSPIMKHIDNPQQLLKTFVFDIWICNVDRHGENLITFPKRNKYSFYLIDHGFALLGAMKWRRVPWNSSYWNHVTKYNRHYVQGLRSYIYSYQQLSPFIEQIQSIPAYKIKKIVKSMPVSVLSPSKKKIVIKLLLYRQENLHVIVNRWMKEYKKNDSRSRVLINKKSRRKMKKRHIARESSSYPTGYYSTGYYSSFTSRPYNTL
ncbi:HipA family kinase [Aneurinibacillus tyrosinisolvens]|uniref:HipA family kinase n=1 Tax=Aneurinibacillus tyrosinisolvens TaxID=1443435 RepID=UPI00069C4F8B|nr:HipA family kinase [Aneurinibacillus tyrosinisolvens]